MAKKVELGAEIARKSMAIVRGKEHEADTKKPYSERGEAEVLKTGSAFPATFTANTVPHSFVPKMSCSNSVPNLWNTKPG